MPLQVWKNDKCRGDHLQNLQKNLGYLINKFDLASSEAAHCAYKEAPDRKMRKNKVTPDADLVNDVLQCPWMRKHVLELLALDG